ncbi:homoserine kinase [Nodosilinea sp. LEGE 06152]|uniref:homoserine kinase n=1 Tax=Nodosilinea sp. LEGE 06152 TaxID=2777966 RepID=UPI00188114A6|nr:homoserine kinase [Nodosilinea sp. LEGE 06152]MBE9160156.1 homoserine kinase [Nodosilinea sp. LEGE 06152]
MVLQPLEAFAVPTSVSVTVPATTANIGPGFDCLGAALTLYNRFRFTLDPAAGEVAIEVRGLEADRVVTDSSNLAYKAFASYFHRRELAVPTVAIAIDLNVPLARGLGSSSTAIVGGLLGANALCDSPLDQAALVAMAIDIEGHPDNVVPALVGGCQLAVANDDGSSTLCPIPWHGEITPVVAIPDFELSTAAARQVLPATYSRADAIFNTAHLGLLLRGLETGRGDWLRVAMGDRIHQPYRQTLIAGYEPVATAAIEAGAYGLVISGAGPTLLALAPAQAAAQVRDAMVTTWQQAGQTVTAQVLALETEGARVSLATDQ